VEINPCNIDPCTNDQTGDHETTEQQIANLDTTVRNKIENAVNNPSSPDCVMGEWSECSQPCNGFQWRVITCNCDVNSTTCLSSRQYRNCDSESSCPGDNQSPIDCYWNEWEPWTNCSLDCDGIRTRHALCYCNNSNSMYDDSFCDGIPPLESEPCNTPLCLSNHKPIQFWQTYNCYGSGYYYQPWPISEKTHFICDSGSNSQYFQMDWFEILNKEPTDIWLSLAQVYILTELNIANEEVEAPLREILSNTNSLLNHYEQLSDSQKDAAVLLTKVLNDYCNTGRMNTTVLTLDAIKSAFGYNTHEMGSPPVVFSPTLISLLSLGTVIALVCIVLFFLWRKGRKTTNENIVTLDPEFDLPDPDEELVPGHTEIYVNGEEETLSYELGKLDEVDM